MPGGRSRMVVALTSPPPASGSPPIANCAHSARSSSALSIPDTTPAAASSCVNATPSASRSPLTHSLSGVGTR